MPDSLHELSKLGVHLQPRDGAAFRGIRFVNDGNEANAQFPSAGVPGIGLRRQTLHQHLVERAEAAGVCLRWGSTVQLMEDRRVFVAGKAMAYGWLVGADGMNSRVRRWAGLEIGSTMSRRFGFRRHFHVKPWSDFVEVHWGQSGQAYVTPTGPDEVCVATVARDPHCRLENLLAELPHLQQKLGRVALDTERGALTTTRRLRRVVSGNIALVGDASGSADAITGEGLGLGFRQALMLAECIESNDLARYHREHAKTLQLPQTMARVMLLMDRSPTFRARALGLLASEPALFTRLLGVHLGAESITRFVAAKGLDVARGLIWPAHSNASTLATGS